MKTSAMERSCRSSILLLLGALLLLSFGCSKYDAGANAPPHEQSEDLDMHVIAETPVTEDDISPDLSDFETGSKPLANEPNSSGNRAAKDDTGSPGDAAVDSGIPANRVDLVFFHIPGACGCLGEIGDVIEAALYDFFPEEMADRTVRYYMVASNHPDNQSYVRMYGSQPFDLFVVTYDEGAAQPYPVRGIWAHMDDYDALGVYVKQVVEEEIAAFST